MTSLRRLSGAVACVVAWLTVMVATAPVATAAGSSVRSTSAPVGADTARAVAIVLVGVVGFWAAAIVSRGRRPRRRFTLYTGARPPKGQ